MSRVTLTITELDAMGACDRWQHIRTRLLLVGADPNHEYTAAEAVKAGCTLDDLLWAAARRAQQDTAVRSRLTGFVNDCLTRVLPTFEDAGAQDLRPRHAINATEAFRCGRMGFADWISQAHAGQQAWAVRLMRDALVVDGFWATANNMSWGEDRPSEYNQWAEWAAWSVGAARRAVREDALDQADNDMTTLSEEELETLETGARAWQLDRLVGWLTPEGASPLEMPPRLASGGHASHGSLGTWPGLDLGWSDLTVVPDRAVFLEGVSLRRNAFVALPNSVRQIGGLQLEDHPRILLNHGLLIIGHIALDYNSSLDLPTTLSYIDSIRIYSCDNGCLTRCSPREIGNVEALQSEVTFPPGLEELGAITVLHSTVSLPKTLRVIGSIFLDGSEHEATLHLAEGLTQAGNITVGMDAELMLPDSIISSGTVEVHAGGKLTLPADAIPESSIKMHPGAEVVRRARCAG